MPNESLYQKYYRSFFFHFGNYIHLATVPTLGPAKWSWQLSSGKLLDTSTSPNDAETFDYFCTSPSNNFHQCYCFFPWVPLSAKEEAPEDPPSSGLRAKQLLLMDYLVKLEMTATFTLFEHYCFTAPRNRFTSLEETFGSKTVIPFFRKLLSNTVIATVAADLKPVIAHKPFTSAISLDHNYPRLFKLLKAWVSESPQPLISPKEYERC